MSVVKSETKKKMTQTERIAIRCAEVDVWLKEKCGQGGDGNRELELIKSEYELLRRFCPGYGQTMFKKAKKFNRKRKVSKVYVTSYVSIPRVEMREGDMVDAEQIDKHHWCGKTRYTWSNDKEGHLVWDEEEPILERELKIPKCCKCLHDYDVNCKHLDRMLETIKMKCDRKAKGSYEFRSMLRRVMGTVWFDEHVEV